MPRLKQEFERHATFLFVPGGEGVKREAQRNRAFKKDGLK